MRTSLQNVMALPDAAQAWNFDFFIPAIPGTTYSAQNLTFKCKTTELPASSIEPVKIELHGVAKQEAGRATYQHTFNTTFMETVDYATYMALRAWRDTMRSWKNNTGTNSQVYKQNCELDLYDNAGVIAQTIIIAGCFPTDIGNVTLDGTQSAVVDLQITWSFDYLNDGMHF